VTTSYPPLDNLPEVTSRGRYLPPSRHSSPPLSLPQAADYKRGEENFPYGALPSFPSPSLLLGLRWVGQVALVLAPIPNPPPTLPGRLNGWGGVGHRGCLSRHPKENALAPSSEFAPANVVIGGVRVGEPDLTRAQPHTLTYPRGSELATEISDLTFGHDLKLPWGGVSLCTMLWPCGAMSPESQIPPIEMPWRRRTKAQTSLRGPWG